MLLLPLTACESFDFPGVYRIEVPQGNVYDQEMIDQLEIGMSPSQVRFILGTPLIKDTFNPDRWDYTYRVQKGSDISNVQRMALYFADEKLARIDHNTPEDGSDGSEAEKTKEEAEGKDG